MLNTNRSLLLSCTAASVLLLAGCAVGPDFERPAAPEVTGYTAMALPASTVAGSADIAGGEAQRFTAGMDVSGQWWTLFESDTLNELVALALEANPDLEAAEAALNQVRENYFAARGPLFPAIGASAVAANEQHAIQQCAPQSL